MKPWRLQEITYQQVRHRDFEVAVLPVGACEPHGLHLPYGCDAFHCTKIADRCCAAAHERGAKIALLPTLPYGVNSNTMGYPLAVHVPQATLNIIVGDIVRAMARHGVHKFVIFNGHGGNDFRVLVRDLFGAVDAFVSTVEWWKLSADKLPEIFTHIGDHADEVETSVALALFPEFVHMEHCGTGRVRPTAIEGLNKGYAWSTRSWKHLTPDTGVGDPRQATQEKGEKLLEIVVERVGQFLKDLSDAEYGEGFPF